MSGVTVDSEKPVNSALLSLLVRRAEEEEQLGRPPVGRRALQVTTLFLRALEEQMSALLQRRFELSLAADSPPEQTALQITLKAFSGKVRLGLSPEAAAELSALVLNQPRPTRIGPLGAEEATAVSFLVVRLLSELPLLQRQAVYLSGVEPPSTATAKQSETQLGVELKLDGRAFYLLVSLCPVFAARLECYGAHRLFPGRLATLVLRHAVSCRLTLEAQMPSIDALASSQMTFIPLAEPVSRRGFLELVPGAQPLRRQSIGEVAVQYRSPGLFTLELKEEKR